VEKYNKQFPMVFFVDNNAARNVAISINSRSRLIAGLVEQLLQVEEIAACFCWFARVPSPSNPANDPSRNECNALINEGVPFVDVYTRHRLGLLRPAFQVFNRLRGVGKINLCH